MGVVPIRATRASSRGGGTSSRGTGGGVEGGAGEGRTEGISSREGGVGFNVGGSGTGGGSTPAVGAGTVGWRRRGQRRFAGLDRPGRVGPERRGEPLPAAEGRFYFLESRPEFLGLALQGRGSSCRPPCGCGRGRRRLPPMGRRAGDLVGPVWRGHRIRGRRGPPLRPGLGDRDPGRKRHHRQDHPHLHPSTHRSPPPWIDRPPARPEADASSLTDQGPDVASEIARRSGPSFRREVSFKWRVGRVKRGPPRSDVALGGPRFTRPTLHFRRPSMVIRRPTLKNRSTPAARGDCRAPKPGLSS